MTDTTMQESGACNEVETPLFCEVDSEDMTREPRKRRIGEETEESEGDWQTVTRDPKRKQRGQSTNKADEKYQVCITHIDKLPKQFALAKLFRYNDIDGITRVKYINPFKILVEFEKDVNADKLICHEEFKKLGWRIHKTWEVDVSYGMVQDIELEITVEELLKYVTSDEPIISIKRLNRRADDGSWVPSERIRIGFVGSRLPPYIYLHQMRIRVESFVFPVTQCSRCWRYGHLVRMCPSNRTRCPKCGDNHANCDSTKFKCCNCSGDHISLSKSCPVYVKEKKIRQLMSEFNCSYQKALTIYVPPSPPPQPMNNKQRDPPQSNAGYSQQTFSMPFRSECTPPGEKSMGKENVKNCEKEAKRKKKRKKKKIFFRVDNQDQEMEWSESEFESETSFHSKSDLNNGGGSSEEASTPEWQVY